MSFVRNQSAPHTDRIQRRAKRAQTGSQLRNGTMTEGVLRIAEDARIEYEGDANLPDIPLATPTRTGLMSADYAAKVEGAPEILVATAVGTRITTGGVVTFYDSGPRDITSYGTNVTSGSSFQVQRTLDSLIFTYSFLFQSAGTGALRFLGDLPTGWRPLAATVGIGTQGADLSRHDIRINANGGATWNFVTDETGTTSQARPNAGALVSGALIIPAQTTLPASLIGQPA